MQLISDNVGRKKWYAIRNCLRKRNIHPDQHKHINCIRIHPTETYEHFIEKCKQVWQLHKIGHDFLTEAWTENRKQRFDILDLIDDIDIEIETGKSKKKKYKADKEVRT